MWYSPKTTTAVTAEPITLAQAKAQVRVEGADEDTLIGRLITAARDHVENVCGQYFAPRTIETYCDGFCDFARLEVVPVTSITAIDYSDTAGSAQVVDDTIYELRADGLDASIALKSGNVWPAILPGSRIKVTAVVGSSEVPASVVHAMMLLIGAWFENREQTAIVGRSIVAELPQSVAVDALLINHRRGT
ncbi:head-tail connector protein [Rhizobium sp. PL01]|uniref:head-tail connector protein n=1 Tax=Rhizobium sp. PL01 TaxID=3085631 RepID=UPI0029825F39|nr:head-tail connector protein [Rhizobium sp. PL01]MDW5315012.1 head-tail connector protein [Rhizobium sp. PL01]